MSTSFTSLSYYSQSQICYNQQKSSETSRKRETHPALQYEMIDYIADRLTSWSRNRSIARFCTIEGWNKRAKPSVLCWLDVNLRWNIRETPWHIYHFNHELLLAHCERCFEGPSDASCKNGCYPYSTICGNSIYQRPSKVAFQYHTCLTATLTVNATSQCRL